MRPECAFFPEKAIFSHIPAPVHLLLLHPLNCLLSCPCSTSTLLQHTFQPGASFLHRRAWYGQPNLQYISANSSYQGTTRIVPSGKTNEWTREFMTFSWGISSITGALLMKGRYYFSVPLCAIESSYVLRPILSYIIPGENEQLSWWIGNWW